MITAGVSDLHPSGDALQSGLRRARPLDENHRLRRHVVVEQGGILLPQVGEAEEIEV